MSLLIFLAVAAVLGYVFYKLVLLPDLTDATEDEDDVDPPANQGE
jgi:hypothetical protein